MRLEGDNHLSARDTQHWGMVWHILAKFGTLTMFKYDMGSVPERIDALLRWFIPAEAKNYSLIEEFLRDEYEEDVTEGRMMVHEGETHYVLGFHFLVLPITGFNPMLEKEEREEMVQAVLEEFLRTAKLRERKDNEN